MKRVYSIFTFLCIATELAFAQVTVKIQAPAQTEVGRKIMVSYTANTQDVEDIQVGEFPGFTVAYGPSTSSASSISIVNGKTTQSSTLTFSYTLVAKEEGKFTIPAATVKVDGKAYKSGTATIEVLPSSGNSQQQTQSGNQQQQSRPSARQRGQVSASDIGSNELYMAVTASKKKIYEQEAILLTYKLYTLVNIRQISGEMPQLDGFHVQEVDTKAQMSIKYERVNGRNYGTAVYRQYVLYPQKTGKLKVPSITFDTQVEFQNTSMDPFDIFFGGGSLTQMVRKSIVAPAIDIEVMPLPTPKPDNFSGAVGKYSISGTLTPEQVNANDAASLKLTVSGQGNMKLMKTPKVNFPHDFEIYDPKVTDKTTNTSTGAKGTVVYDYVVVPRLGGKYSIAPVSFCYFDPDEESYKTLLTDSFHIAVAKSKTTGSSDYHEQEDLKVLSNDIRFIKLGNVRASESDTDDFGSTFYWLRYLILTVFYIIGLLLLNYIRKNPDKYGISQKANKVANKRLKTASKLLKQHQSEAFFDEVMKALLGYAGDKLDIQQSDLNKDNVSEKLQTAGVQQQLVDAYMNIISECEFARYAPGDPDATMEKIFTSASQVLNDLDAAIGKRKKKDNYMKHYVIVFPILLFFTANIYANDNDALKTQADSAYSQEKYDKAIKLYEKLANDVQSFEVCYNLGCSYYRKDNIAKSLLWLERASRLNPSDEDVQFNLTMVRNKTVDKITPEHEMIIVSMFRKLVNMMSLESWSLVCIMLFVLSLASSFLYFLSHSLYLRKLGVLLSVVCLLLCVFGNVCAYQQRTFAMSHNHGIIMSPSVTVKSTPSESGNDLFVIHEGTSVEILDSSMKDWYEIKIADGKLGWMHKKSLELI